MYGFWNCTHTVTLASQLTAHTTCLCPLPLRSSKAVASKAKTGKAAAPALGPGQAAEDDIAAQVGGGGAAAAVSEGGPPSVCLTEAFLKHEPANRHGPSCVPQQRPPFLWPVLSP